MSNQISCNCGNKIPVQEVACSEECRQKIHQPGAPPPEDWRFVGMSQESNFARVVWAWMSPGQREAVIRELKGAEWVESHRIGRG